MINHIDVPTLKDFYEKAMPFNHVVIDNFWKSEIANQLQKEINSFTLKSKDVSIYDNPLEKKITCNHYDRFPKKVYQAFTYLNSNNFLKIISKIAKVNDIIADIGLSGGGLHIHPTGGKLNIHKDYSIHPKLMKERRLNLIIYMTENWQEEWGGNLQLWSHDEETNKPLNLVKEISNKFNRAILFDTTQNSWHGLPDVLKTPKGINRQSMAVYYLTEPREGVSERDRALFVPTKEQEKDKQIIELIKKRSSSKTSSDTYRQK